MISSGRSVTDVAEALGIGTPIIYRWISLSRQGESSDGKLSNPYTAEYERLKAELRRTEQERDILKKALGIFSRGN